MNYAQVIFKVLEEERGYQVKHYEAQGYNRNTIRSWIRGETSPKVSEIPILLKTMHYDHVKMLIKVARYEHKRLREKT